MTSTLTLDTVTVSFPRPGQADLTVLNAFDLTVNPGEFHVLAGRSGSGKTTALRVAAHLLQPTTGHVRWGDTNPATLTRDALADLRRTWVAYVDQDAHVLDGLRALDNVLLPLIPSGITNTHRQLKRPRFMPLLIWAGPR